MSFTGTAPPRTGLGAAADARAGAKPARTRRAKLRTSLFAHGQPMVWLNGGALATAIFMIVGLLVLVFRQGLATFWPGPLVQVRTLSGARLLGEVTREESYRPAQSVFSGLPEGAREKAAAFVEEHGGTAVRRLLRTGNFELTNSHFHWVSDFEIVEETRPEWAMIFERLTNDGRFYGVPKEFLLDGKPVATDPEESWTKYQQFLPKVRQRREQIARLRNDQVGKLDRTEEQARQAVRWSELEHGRDSSEHAAAVANLQSVTKTTAIEHEKLSEEIRQLEKENKRFQLRLITADGAEQTLPLGDIVRAYPANRLSFWQELGVYASRWWEFLSDDPRNSNSEGGVFPAIWGTATMTLLMSLAVVPFGVLAALYLREYAKAGFVVSAVRIAVNNLAGVPSIVFGVFGLGFFCYIIGGSVDDWLFKADLPTPTFGKGGLLWASLTLALLTLPVVIVSTEEALAAVPHSMREGSYACGASKWQTIRRIVLPRAMPGIMTGLILAMARGAGEVAPLMLVGAVKLAAHLPVDGVFPYVHPQRSFLHLGFQIYDVGFQSQNSEAAKPMVFTTTLLLIALIALLNVTAVWMRTRLRKRYVANQF